MNAPALMPATMVINPDEKCYMLVERNLPRPDSRGVHRYQIVYVVRDDALAEWRRDLGPAKRFKAPECRIPGLFEHTVAELQEIAESQRLGDDYWQKRTQELQGESTLITDFIDFIEVRHNLINNRSVIGPAVRKQRNGMSVAALKERMRA